MEAVSVLLNAVDAIRPKKIGEEKFSPKYKAVLGEIVLWVLCALLISLPVLWRIINENALQAEEFESEYNRLSISIFLVIFPIIFNAIFGALPLELIRIRRMTLEERVIYRGKRAMTVHPTASQSNGREGSEVPPPVSQLGPMASPAMSTLQQNAEYSRQLAAKIYSRAGVYLLIGGLTALGGLWFFYSKAPVITKADITSIIVEMAPRISILLFVELIAFFFLRQYRGAMDEFKYYEAIQRSREEMVFSLYVLEANGDMKGVTEALSKNLFSSLVNPLPSGQTTEVVELRKLESDDLNGIAKIVEAFAALKK